jgi:hypothetical protein
MAWNRRSTAGSASLAESTFKKFERGSAVESIPASSNAVALRRTTGGTAPNGDASALFHAENDGTATITARRRDGATAQRRDGATAQPTTRGLCVLWWSRRGRWRSTCKTPWWEARLADVYPTGHDLVPYAARFGLT